MSQDGIPKPPALRLVYNNTPINERGDMLCLTDMWRSAGSDESRTPSKWIRSADAERFIGFLAETLNLQNSYLWTSEPGRHNGGTWAHKLIALAYAKYLLPALHAHVNEVFFAAYEGRALPLAPTMAPTASAITLTVADLDRFAAKTGEAAGESAARTAVALVQQSINPRLDAIENRQSTQEAILQQLLPRIDPSKRTVRLQLEAVAKRGGRCPCCHDAILVDADGLKTPITEFDHRYARNRNKMHEVWPVCEPCNKVLIKRREEFLNDFESFQRYLRAFVAEKQSGKQLILV